MEARATEIKALFPQGKRTVGIFGSLSFYSKLSAPFCQALGVALAKKDYVLITGGMTGVQEETGRAMIKENPNSHIFHLLPDYGASPIFTGKKWDFGETLKAGEELAQRREIFARTTSRFIVIEGGPGTVHEISIALSNCATCIPIFCTGGAAGGNFDVDSKIFTKPTNVEESDWAKILNLTDPAILVEAVLHILEKVD